MSNTQKALVGLVALALLAGVTYLVWPQARTLGGVTYDATVKWWGNGLYAGLAQQFSIDSDGDLTTTANSTFATTTQNGVSTVVTGGSCNSATSTLFANINPFVSTSTAELVYIQGLGNATTTDLRVGTSTRTTGLTTTGVGAVWPVLVDKQIPTTTPFYIRGGVFWGHGNGNITGAGTTTPMIVVGPTESVGAFATTTATGAGAAQYSGGYSNCTYRIRWTN